MNDGKPEWDDDLAAKLVNSVVLVGITREGPDGITLEEFFGTVAQADPSGIVLLLQGVRAADHYHLPPDPRAFFPAEPGSYRLRSTGEVVENPDFTATWKVFADNRGAD
jgi:hypothetical protein